MNEPFTNTPPPQLASYTINDTTGAIVSTNTWADMPTPQLSAAAFLEMSPSGKLLVVGGDEGGIQIFHFNGAAPITPYSGVLLPNIQANQLTWDNNNHLYVLSYLSGEIYVFTVTPTSISEVSASPYKIPGLTGMIVVPK
jgi:6-phosphogluconolactonase (cycloisomerase 2 family)